MRLNISKRVACIIVTFNPDIPLLSMVLERTAKQVEVIVIVDNDSSNLIQIRKIAMLFCETTSIQLLDSPKNNGTAVAMNKGVEFLLKNHEMGWVLFLDQDSLISESYVNDLINRLEKEYDGDKEKIYVIRGSVKYGDSVYGQDSPFIHKIKGDIMSGTLVRSDTFSFIKFREDLFMDFVETDFYFNLSKLQGDALEFNPPNMIHRLGTKIHLIGRDFMYQNPQRVYYMIRNSTTLVKERKGGLHLLMVGYYPVLFTFIKDGVRLALSTLFKGITDGINNAHK